MARAVSEGQEPDQSMSPASFLQSLQGNEWGIDARSLFMVHSTPLILTLELARRAPKSDLS